MKERTSLLLVLVMSLALAGKTFDMGDAAAGGRYIVTAKQSDGFMSYDLVLAKLSLMPHGAPGWAINLQLFYNYNE